MTAKFNVKHACGHEETHAHGGTPQERAQREAWLRNRPCRACWQKQRSDSATAQNQQLNLPVLQGSDTDIAWAEVIRTKAMPHNMDHHRRLINSKSLAKELEATRQAVTNAANEALHDLETQSSASWWIEHRFDVLDYVRRKAVTALTPIVEAADETRTSQASENQP